MLESYPALDPSRPMFSCYSRSVDRHPQTTPPPHWLSQHRIKESGLSCTQQHLCFIILHSNPFFSIYQFDHFSNMSPTPGLLYALSKPKSSSFSDADYNTWYTNHHIHDVVNSGLADLAIRYKNTNPNAKWPYLAIYRIPDLAKMQDEKVMGSIAATHELIPNGATWHDALEADIRPFVLLQKFEGQVPKEGPRGTALRTVMVEPAKGTDDEFDEVRINHK
jgi:hypothetical protein